MSINVEGKAIEARDLYEKNPTLYNLIWYGRRVAYTGDYILAIDLFTKGLDIEQNSPELLRHRGHRYISIKKFDLAINDLELAKQIIEGTEDKIEEDGMPNSKNIPLSTLFFNIYYHLGLAYYLEGDFEKSLHEYTNCLAISKNDDSIVACKYWLYLISRQLKDESLFDVPKDMTSMNIIENFAYLHLLKLYMGLITTAEVEELMQKAIDKATLDYGVAMYYLFTENTAVARKIFMESVENNHPSAFGTIAAEVELKRFPTNIT